MSTDAPIDGMKWEEWAGKHTDPANVRRKPEALDGTIVLDLSYGNFAGLFCSSTLSPSADYILLEGSRRLNEHRAGR